MVNAQHKVFVQRLADLIEKRGARRCVVPPDDSQNAASLSAFGGTFWPSAGG
ncbi:MAG: hypothetical protein Q8K98_12325 [Bacteroidota bacterium]|nr:hypothetical protein [Bacteroidota bacterium]